MNMYQPAASCTSTASLFVESGEDGGFGTNPVGRNSVCFYVDPVVLVASNRKSLTKQAGPSAVRPFNYYLYCWLNWQVLVQQQRADRNSWGIV
jgi:hypothetical protein